MHLKIRAAGPASIVCLLVLGLSACGGGSESDVSPTTPPVPAPAPAGSVRSDATVVTASADRSQAAPTQQITLTLQNATASDVLLYGDYTSFGLERVTSQTLSASQIRIRFYYRPPTSLTNGLYSDTVVLYLCRDESCTQMLSGSPLTIASTYTVSGFGGSPGAPPDPVGTPLVPRSRTALPHNVIDAEYSRSLDRIVMVSTYPTNALHVRDPATGTASSVALSRAPTAVSISPDGLRAAVGHDALVSIVDLAAVGQSGAPAPVLLNVSAVVHDLVLDDRDRVHVFPRVDQWVHPHSINIATNTETLGSFGLRAGSLARLHPSGNFVYSADNGLSPSDIRKWDIGSGVATSLWDSPYHGDYGMCGNLWFNESGSRVFTRCGNSFSSDTDRTLDMRYTGKLALSVNATYSSSYGVVWLDHSATRSEIALIEASQAYGCGTAGPNDPCYTHLGTFDDGFLTLRNVYTIAPFMVNGSNYEQRGLFVFYRSDGTRKYLLSQLMAMPNPATEYYLSVLD